MVYVYRDIYNYLHGVNRDLLGPTITKYTNKYVEIDADIAEGGFLKIYICKTKYTIIDNGYSILLLHNNKFSIPSESDMVLINNFYLKHNLYVLPTKYVSS